MSSAILKEFLKKNLPFPAIRLLRAILNIVSRVKRFFIYPEYDSSVYWRNRAKGEGQSRVLWRNEEYNRLYREIQRSFLEPYLRLLKDGDWVLDVGCGIGIVARMMADLNPKINIDAIDFPEMIEVARRENPGNNIHYIASAAEEYFNPKKQYALIISSGCFSAIRHVPTMERAMENCVRMLARGGYILMMDPFHRWSYLARVKYSSWQVVQFMRARGLRLTYQSGALFWPYRVFLCNSSLPPAKLQKYFRQGERLLEILGHHMWADYKILVFQKPT